MKFTPHNYNNPQVATYAKVKEHLVLHLQNAKMDWSYDVADSISNMQLVDLGALKPVRQLIAEDTNIVNEDVRKATQKVKQEAKNLEHSIRMKLHIAREQKLVENMRNAYSTIITKYCTKTMVQRIEAHIDFTSKIQNDPIELLKAIEVLMHDPVRARYPLASLTDSLVRFLSLKFEENEAPLDYAKRYKQHYEVLVSQAGEHFLDHFIKQTEDYRNLDKIYTDVDDLKEAQDSMLDGAMEQWLAYLILRGSNIGVNKNKYGSISRGMQSQYSMNNDQYPRTVINVTDILTNHTWDNRTTVTRKGNQKNDKSN